MKISIFVILAIFILSAFYYTKHFSLHNLWIEDFQEQQRVREIPFRLFKDRYAGFADGSQDLLALLRIPAIRPPFIPAYKTPDSRVKTIVKVLILLVRSIIIIPTRRGEIVTEP